MKDGYTKYKTANIDTADQGKLILIAYDVAIKHSRLALDVFEDKSKIEARTKYLFKVQDAITELMSALKLDVGEVAQNLYKLYEYMLWRLVHASTKGKKEFVKEVLDHLVSLRDAWKDAIETLKSQTQTAGDNGQSKSITVSG